MNEEIEVLALRGTYVGVTKVDKKDIEKMSASTIVASPYPYVHDETYDFFFLKENLFGNIEISLDHKGLGFKTYKNLVEFFKEWSHVSSLT